MKSKWTTHFRYWRAYVLIIDRFDHASRVNLAQWDGGCVSHPFYDQKVPILSYFSAKCWKKNSGLSFRFVASDKMFTDITLSSLLHRRWIIFGFYDSLQELNLENKWKEHSSSNKDHMSLSTVNSIFFKYRHHECKTRQKERNLNKKRKFRL